MLTRLKAQLFLQTLRSAEQVPAQHLSQYTAGLVNQLICHAVASPFWRERLAMLVTHDGTISLDRWQEVPLLTDAEAHRVGAEGLAAHMGHEDEIVDTGPSAGPFGRRDRLALLADLCVFERVLELHRIALSVPLVDILEEPFLFAEDWSWNTTFAKATHEAISFAWPPRMQVEALRAHAGSILRASPKTLRGLLDAIADTGGDFPKLAAVVSVGAPISDSLCHQLLDRIARAVAAIWHDSRLGIIAFGDPSGVGWRIANETQFIEIVEANGRRTLPWETGCVAVTPLYNYWTPAIRFTPGWRARSSIGPDGRQRLTELAPHEGMF
jgi:hypothetical protein